MQLFHHTTSAGSRAVRLALGEYGLDAELHEERTFERREAFLAMNPAGTLPVLADEQVVVSGAGPVAEYLDETSGPLNRDRRLFPETAAGRAEMRRVAEWALVKLEAEVTRYTVNERVTKRLMSAAQGGGAPDSRALRAARANIRYHLRYFGYLAGTRRWLAGDRLTWADLAAAAALSVLDYLGEVDWAGTEEGTAELRDWYARMKSRPSFRPLLADRIRSMPPASHYADLDF